MPQPTPYTRQYDFENWQSSNPSEPLPATPIENEFDAVKTALDSTQDKLELIQRDDGALRNQIVTPDSLSPATRALLALAGATIDDAGWQTATEYAEGTVLYADEAGAAAGTYLCATDHTSGTFSTDLAAGKWLLIQSDEAVEFPVAVNQGGTGATNASSARANLGAAAAGENGDIEELTGLQVPLSVDQGGTGADTENGARAAFDVYSTAQVDAAIAAAIGALTSPASLLPAQCRLDYVSGSEIKLNRFRGSALALLSAESVPTVRTIPSGGVALAPSGLTPGSRYYIYAYWTGSAIALVASSTGHAEDATTGLRVKNDDPTRLLVGMVEIVTGPAFEFSAANKLVTSWHNRKPATAVNFLANDSAPSTTSATELTTGSRIRWMAWAGEVAQVTGAGRCYGLIATAAGKTLIYSREDGGSFVENEGMSSGTTASVAQENVPVAPQAAVIASADNTQTASLYGISSSANNMVWTGHASDKDKRCSILASFLA